MKKKKINSSFSLQLIGSLICSQTLWAAGENPELSELKAAVRSIKASNDQIETKIRKIKAQLGSYEKSEVTLQDKAAVLSSGIQKVWASLEDRADKAELGRTQVEFNNTDPAYRELETYLVTLFKRRDAFTETNALLESSDPRQDFGMEELRGLSDKLSQLLSDYNFALGHP